VSVADGSNLASHQLFFAFMTVREL
jgi:hypothetical protein